MKAKTHLRNGELYDLLQKFKAKELWNIIDMSEEEIEQADELVRRNLLAKFVTNLTVFYTYGYMSQGQESKK